MAVPPHRSPRADLSATRGVLGEFLEGVAESGSDIPTHLTKVMSSWLAERRRNEVFDWRYYLVKYPSMRGEHGGHKQAKTGIYWGSTVSSATRCACCAPCS